MSNSNSSRTSKLLEASSVVLHSMYQHPLTVGQALLITFGLFVLAWTIYISFFLLAVRTGILDEPSETDLERGHDPYALSPQFIRTYEQWITMMKFINYGRYEPYQLETPERRYAEEMARKYGTMKASPGVRIV